MFVPFIDSLASSILSNVSSDSLDSIALDQMNIFSNLPASVDFHALVHEYPLIDWCAHLVVESLHRQSPISDLDPQLLACLNILSTFLHDRGTMESFMKTVSLPAYCLPPSSPLFLASTSNSMPSKMVNVTILHAIVSLLECKCEDDDITMSILDICYRFLIHTQSFSTAMPDFLMNIQLELDYQCGFVVSLSKQKNAEVEKQSGLILDNMHGRLFMRRKFESANARWIERCQQEHLLPQHA